MSKKIKNLEKTIEIDESKIKDQKSQLDTLNKEIADHSNSLIKSSLEALFKDGFSGEELEFKDFS